MTICKECGSEFKQNGKGRPRLFCKDYCRIKNFNKRNNVINNPKRKFKNGYITKDRIEQHGE